MPSAGTLKPALGEGVNEATTRHVFIEGDNLEVLKLLQKSYAGRVKMIYIDPPYNTGNDFIYSDNFTQPLEEYLRATGQADEMGRVLVTNTKSGGRYHSNWLNMMYPRLRLARNLLRNDGVIFISIDDHEVGHLRLLLSEVFGEENLLGPLVWKRRTGSNDAQDNISVDHEYVMIARASEDYGFGGVQKDFSKYKNPDNDPRGPWAFDNLTCNKTAQQRPNLFYPITDPSTGIKYEANPNRVWAYERERMNRIILDGKVIWPKDGRGTPQYKRHLSEVRSERKPVSTWIETSTRDVKEVESESENWDMVIGQTSLNQQGTKELRSLFDTQVFDYPKPVSLLSFLIEQSSDNDGDDIIVDFFAGSGTTGQAMIEVNQKTRGNRRFVLVQLPEPVPAFSAAKDAGFDTVADVSKERIRRVIQRMQAEAVDKPPERETPEDLGFKVFKLDRSNFKAWRDFDGGDPSGLGHSGQSLAGLQTLFDQFESPLAEGWQAADLLVEVLLMEGFPLDSAVTTAPEFARNTVQIVTSDLVAHRLFVCLDAVIHPTTIAALVLGDEDIFICLDSALSDEAKVQLEDGRRVKVI
jgi:adenine-specific DNA-methyltransferase